MGRKRPKNPAAVELGRRGGLKAAGKGGRIYWARMTAEEKADAMAKVRAGRKGKR